jgi:hypothetical protein
MMQRRSKRPRIGLCVAVAFGLWVGVALTFASVRHGWNALGNVFWREALSNDFAGG